FRNTWSVGAGWNIHKEKFLTDKTDFFQVLKLRASVGNPGNQNFSAYRAFSTYKFNGWMTNVFGAGVIVKTLGNKGLAWQETINYDLGSDITFWGSRVNITFDYFWKNTDPLLAIISTKGSMGVSTIAMNAGGQNTNGWEATFKISPIYRPSEGINWNISLNATSSKSRYVNIGNAFSSLNESGKTSLVGTTRYYDGGSPTAIWAVRSAGIDPATGKELFIKKDGSYSFTYDVNDEVVVGDTQPKIEGVLGTTLYYKGFSVGCYLRYRLGGQVFNSSLFQKVENIGTEEVYNNQDRRALYDRWSEDNREAYFKGISMVQKTDKSSRFVMDENTLTGESFNVGYEFPDRMIRKLHISALSLQMSLNDIFRISSVRVERGIDYPFARNVSFSIGVTF
ncbi:MAG: SusC/RagA family TonB-linked outer membrane protein, partial [Bacteroidales bacterium]|nr:SusC/RagA family TonB-linked outer membrane protein [Bacteroidales bacterium]